MKDRIDLWMRLSDDWNGILVRSILNANHISSRATGLRRLNDPMFDGLQALCPHSPKGQHGSKLETD